MSTILLVDDDPHLRELSRVFLQQEGFDVYEASDGYAQFFPDPDVNYQPSKESVLLRYE